MPELPEVETIVRDLCRSRLVGARIIRLEVFWPKTLAGADPQQLKRRIRGASITCFERHGKLLILRLSDGHCFVIHLRMSGRLLVRPGAEPRDKHEHFILYFEDGRSLRFSDARKFGRIVYAASPSVRTDKLGEDAYAGRLEAGRFCVKLGGKKKGLKALLLDQTFLAGIGNIYADEILWKAGLHPLKHAHRLTQVQAERLYRAIRSVLGEAIAHRGTSISKTSANFYSLGVKWGQHQDYLKVYRRTGKPCVACGGSIRRTVVAQRSTHFCPACQPRGRQRK